MKSQFIKVPDFEQVNELTLKLPDGEVVVVVDGEVVVVVVVVVDGELVVVVPDTIVI